MTADQSNSASQALSPALVPSTGWTAPLIGIASGAMAFLGVLCLAAALSAGSLASQWRSDLAGVATVRVSATGAAQADRLDAVLEVLRTTPGVLEARVLSDEEQRDLIVPWLGEGAALPDLPMPQLIDVTLEGEGPDAAALQGRLDLTVSGVTYDDHAAWRGPLARAADGLEGLALASALVTLLTVGALVAFAAHATLMGNRVMVETLRLIGAEEDFIRRAFVGRLVYRAAAGSTIGTLAGCLALFLLPTIGNADPDLASALALGVVGWVVLVVMVPAFATGVTWVSARAAVSVTLKRMP